MVMVMVRVIFIYHMHVVMNNELRYQQTAFGPFMSLHNFDMCDKWKMTTYI